MREFFVIGARVNKPQPCNFDRRLTMGAPR
jgi:hypothetical protein